MLVKKSIVERWYQRNSWVYKNFAYLFQNPLWQKTVPQGFSVCPYFWLNLFSLFIFRPFFVMPIHYVFRPFIRVLGKPAASFDEFLRTTFTKCGMIPSRPPQGAGIAFGILWSIIAAGVSYILYLIATEFYPYITTNNTLGLFGFWSTLSFIGMWAVIGIHKKVSETECKTHNYLYVWFALLLVTMFIFIPSEAIDGLKTFIGGVGFMIGQLWNGLCAVIAWIGKWLWFFVSWKPVDAFVIPWPAYVAILGVFGLLADRIMQALEDAKATPLNDETHYKERNRDAWLSVFIKTLYVNKHWRSGDEFVENYYRYACSNTIGSDYTEAAMINCKDTIYRRAMEIFFETNLKQLKEKYPLLTREQMENVRESGNSETRFRRLGLHTQTNISFDVDLFRIAIEKAVAEPVIKTMIDNLAADFKRVDEARQQRKEARKNSPMRLMCLRVTGGIGIVVGCIKNVFMASILALWTFLVYLWMLIKAKKQGACPYFRFTDTTEKK